MSTSRSSSSASINTSCSSSPIPPVLNLTLYGAPAPRCNRSSTTVKTRSHNPVKSRQARSVEKAQGKNVQKPASSRDKELSILERTSQCSRSNNKSPGKDSPSETLTLSKEEIENSPSFNGTLTPKKLSPNISNTSSRSQKTTCSVNSHRYSPSPRSDFQETTQNDLLTPTGFTLDLSSLHDDNESTISNKELCSRREFDQTGCSNSELVFSERSVKLSSPNDNMLPYSQSDCLVYTDNSRRCEDLKVLLHEDLKTIHEVSEFVGNAKTADWLKRSVFDSSECTPIIMKDIDPVQKVIVHESNSNGNKIQDLTWDSFLTEEDICIVTNIQSSPCHKNYSSARTNNTKCLNSHTNSNREITGLRTPSSIAANQTENLSKYLLDKDLKLSTLSTENIAQQKIVHDTKNLTLKNTYIKHELNRDLLSTDLNSNDKTDRSAQFKVCGELVSLSGCRDEDLRMVFDEYFDMLQYSTASERTEHPPDLDLKVCESLKGHENTKTIPSSQSNHLEKREHNYSQHTKIQVAENKFADLEMGQFSFRNSNEHVRSKYCPDLDAYKASDKNNEGNLIEFPSTPCRRSGSSISKSSYNTLKSDHNLMRELISLDSTTQSVVGDSPSIVLSASEVLEAASYARHLATVLERALTRSSGLNMPQHDLQTPEEYTMGETQSPSHVSIEGYNVKNDIGSVKSREESNFMEVELDLAACVLPKCCTDEEKSIKLKKRRQRSSSKETKSSLVTLREHNEGSVPNSAEDQAATLEVGLGETIDSTELKESVKIKANLEIIKETVDILEESIVCSSQAESQHVYETTLIKLGNNELVQQLDKERRINKNLNDMFFLQASPTTKWHDEISNRCTCDTESQKKVQELTGALKERGRQIRRMKREMKIMQQQIDKLSQKVAARDEAIASLGDKLKHLEEVKSKQVDDLRNKLRSSQSSCDLVMRTLEQNCHSVEEHMKEELSRTRNPARAQLIEEIRRCNQLTYENVALRHKVIELQLPKSHRKRRSHRQPPRCKSCVEPLETQPLLDLPEGSSTRSKSHPNMKLGPT